MTLVFMIAFIPLDSLNTSFDFPERHVPMFFQMRSGVPRESGENREAGENPARSRHCEEIR